MSDFIIENNILKKYTGPGGDVVVPDGVDEIADDAFRGCEQLTNIRLPDSVVVIGDGAFSGCRHLTGIAMPGVIVIGSCAFWKCIHLTDVAIPDGAAEIGEEAFSGCTRLTHIALPDSVSEIGVGAFRECMSLTDITLPAGLTGIRDDVFWRCERLLHVTFPASLTRIGKQAFYGCKQLTDVVLPDSVTRIGKGAFAGCEGLMRITLPAGLTTIDYEEIGGCSPQTVYWPGRGNINWWALKNAHCIIFPHVSPAIHPFFGMPPYSHAAVRGFLRAPEQYTDAAIRAEYTRCAIGARNEFLPEIFAEDRVSALRFYAEQSAITAENFDPDYLTPATAVHAAECTAFLLEWRHRHLPEAGMEPEKEWTM